MSYILAKAGSGDLVTHARDRVESLLRARHHVPAGAPAGFRVSDPAAAMAAQRRSSRTIGWLLAAIASISLVVGGISIMNIMLVSVAEQTREIGLRLALGATRGHISRLFLTEALLICVVGGLIGVAAGGGASWLISGITDWPVLIDPSTVAAALAFSTVIGLVFGFYPARRAAGLLPATALRSD